MLGCVLILHFFWRMIQVKDISKSFNDGRTFSVKQISFTLDTGKTLVLLGGSGCGKTTLLKMINRLIEPTQGSIEIDGQDIRTFDPISLRRSIGYVFQKAGLFPHMTIAENVSIALRLQKRPFSERQARARELLALVNLDADLHANRFPHELSGGQLQRAGVARALACSPDYLLMDEPFAALDAINRDALQEELLILKQKIQKTIIFVTHDIFEAIRIGDDIAVINNGELEQIGDKKSVIQAPKTPYVQTLFEQFHKQIDQFSAYF